MGFPATPRAIYQRNTIEEVVCQFRYPTILRIDAEAPVEFQECLRNQYPFYENKALGFGPGMPPKLARMLLADLAIGGQKSHEFTSQDKQWVIALARESITLTCKKYDRWETFREQFSAVINVLQAVYAPAFCARLGLRYRNIIRRSSLDASERPWSDLLQPWIIGPYGSTPVVQDIEGAQLSSIIRLPEVDGAVQFQCGLAVQDATQEEIYLLDADFYSKQQTEIPHAFEKLNALNLQAGRFFRWCITDTLHHALVPVDLS